MIHAQCIHPKQTSFRMFIQSVMFQFGFTVLFNAVEANLDCRLWMCFVHCSLWMLFLDEHHGFLILMISLWVWVRHLWWFSKYECSIRLSNTEQNSNSEFRHHTLWLMSASDEFTVEEFTVHEFTVDKSSAKLGFKISTAAEKRWFFVGRFWVRVSITLRCIPNAEG